MLRPVLECLQRELKLQMLLEKQATAETNAMSDLDVLLATSGRRHGDDADEDVQHLLQSVTNHMHCEFAALVVPERNLVVGGKGRRAHRGHRHPRAAAPATAVAGAWCATPP